MLVAKGFVDKIIGGRFTARVTNLVGTLAKGQLVRITGQPAAIDGRSFQRRPQPDLNDDDEDEDEDDDSPADDVGMPIRGEGRGARGGNSDTYRDARRSFPPGDGRIDRGGDPEESPGDNMRVPPARGPTGQSLFGRARGGDAPCAVGG